MRIPIFLSLFLTAHAFVQRPSLQPKPLSVATDTETIATAGQVDDNRLAQAFAQAKEDGKAAFVTFITAGYPEKDGTTRLSKCC